MTLLTDEELLEAFLSRTLTHDHWTHCAHVRVAYLHLMRYGFRDSLSLLRSRIKRLNAAHGVVDAIDHGYHETITRAFLLLIAAAARDDKSRSSQQFYDHHPELQDKRVLLKYYSRDRIMSAEAKAQLIEPDLTALPDVHT